jgi:anti-sigma B factor antagonist
MGITSNRLDENKGLIKIQGEFDIKNCFSFKEEILQLLSDDIKEIKVDLSEMDFIDSPGIGIFLSTAFALNKLGGGFILKAPQMHVYDLLEATQVTKFLIVESD